MAERKVFDYWTNYNNTPERKEFMKEYNKAYRQSHSNIVVCECGAEYKSINQYSHRKSKRHLFYLLAQTL